MHGPGPVSCCPPHLRLAALQGPERRRVARVPLDCRVELAAAQRTISRLRRGLLNTAERAALRRRLPRTQPAGAALPVIAGDRSSDPPRARKPYAPDPPGRVLLLDAMG